MKSSAASLHFPPRYLDDNPASTRADRGADRRRLALFCITFLSVAVIGLVVDFTRPAQYRAETRLEIEPGSEVALAATPNGSVAEGVSGPHSAFVAQVQRLTSRPLIEAARTRLLATGMRLEGLREASVESLQEGLGVEAVPESKVAQVWSVGRDPETAALLLNALVTVYRERIASEFGAASAETLARARDEAERLQAAVAAKRSELEAFQLSHGIVSGERDDNAQLNHLRDSAKAMVDANTRLVAAEARLNALRASAASGQSTTRSRDNPTIAGMEQRLSQARENLRDMERNYTQDYLAIDPNAKALRARIAELERQLNAERSTSANSSIAEAQAEVADARATVQALQRQAAAERGSLQGFSLKLAQFKALQQSLTQLEAMQHAALERAVKLEASERARMPSVKVIEEAAIPHEVWRPRYWRDAGFVLLAALLIALFAVWLLGFIFKRERPQAIVVTPAWPVGGLPMPAPMAQIAAEGDQRLLAASPVLPRELAPDELARLIETSSNGVRIAVLALLAGLKPQELLALRWRDVDVAEGLLTAQGEEARAVPLSPRLAAELSAATPSPDGDRSAPVLQSADGAPLGGAALQTQLLCAAHDAGLDDAASITPDAVRHTYLAFLLRQGVRLADLFARVGSLSPESVPAYTALAPGGHRINEDEVRWTHPAGAGNAASAPAV
ncbi:hypothetical protein GCM10025771_21720 [Niveibacterium umoris]|uniref:Uncharacterized protein involved in exopolysaccharide biosynthesis n=1 Tax=Niveibacterium umoris TaxID=1193620 RepID=A0A840BM50_9RHOO|nr:tyrosine-type recombinase/integrase [Niveibacterium umoris]MBB4012638.1 uncharacterized protein involved in exopolysaccharide biosynthesis [Niveibacterium umoris]